MAGVHRSFGGMYQIFVSGRSDYVPFLLTNVQSPFSFKYRFQTKICNVSPHHLQPSSGIVTQLTLRPFSPTFLPSRYSPLISFATLRSELQAGPLNKR